MDLTTRCPRCGTVFEASLADLQLRKGYIRCVQCAHIFDGYAEVVSDTDTDTDVAAQTPRQEPGFDASPDEAGADAWSAAAPEQDTSRHFLPRPAPSVPPWSADERMEPLLDYADDADSPEEAGPRIPAVIVEADPHRRRAVPGGVRAPSEPDPQGLGAVFQGTLARVLLVILLALGVFQLAYVYRAQLSQSVPALRPWLERACASLACQVPYLRDVSQIAITGSALKAVSPAGGDDAQDFVLQLSLRNRAEQPQQWPTLVLDLKDGAGTLVVRRNLDPADYLGADQAARPFAARSEVLLRVPFRVQGVRVNGYQLDLFFP